MFLAKFIGSFSYLLTCDDGNSHITLLQLMDAKFVQTWREMKELSKLRDLASMLSRFQTLKKLVRLEYEVSVFANWVKCYIYIQQLYDLQTCEIDRIMQEAKKVADERAKFSKFCQFEEIVDWNWGVCRFHDEDFKDVKDAIDFARGLFTKHWEEDWFPHRMLEFSQNMLHICRRSVSVLDAKKRECDRYKSRASRGVSS